MDGDKRAHVHPTNGVKQGPLSPLLFSLYINDLSRDISEGIRGAVTGDGLNAVPYMLYADDLSFKERKKRNVYAGHRPRALRE
eukprot:723781-Pelagomonas_calceolata.AAC.1